MGADPYEAATPLVVDYSLPDGQLEADNLPSNQSPNTDDD